MAARMYAFRTVHHDPGQLRTQAGGCIEEGHAVLAGYQQIVAGVGKRQSVYGHSRDRVIKAGVDEVSAVL
jgi:hypothetical protein